MLTRISVLILLALMLRGVCAHDSSTYGGLYRSRDFGATWMPADAGVFISAANALAISPIDATHLLYGTDNRLLRSDNGGRDWTPVAPDVLVEPVFAVVFATDGRGAIVSTGSTVFHSADGVTWQAAEGAEGAAPARTIIHGHAAGEYYLAGAEGLFLSRDGGHSWVRTGSGLPAGAVDALILAAEQKEKLYALAQRRIWLSEDGGRSFQLRHHGSPQGTIEAIARDTNGVLWAIGGNQLYRGGRGGENWAAYGERLTERASAHSLAVFNAGETIVVNTERGLLRSRDHGKSWATIEGTLPIHLEGGPLVADPREPGTLYAGFALRPYAELLRFAEQAARQAREDANRARFGVISAAVALAVACGVALAWWLARRKRHSVARVEQLRESAQ